MTSQTDNPIVYVSIGSNIEPEANLQSAVDKLREHCAVLAISSVYQTAPYGNTEQPDFLDVVVKLTTDKEPADFKINILRKIESDLGRIRTPENKYGPLTLDMDIMLWGDSTFDYGEKPWHVPNAGILEYAADALPIAEIAPNLIHPETGQTMTEIIEGLDQSGIMKIEVKIS